MNLIAAYAEGISELTRYSKKAKEMPLFVDIIVNPYAGFFRKKQKLKEIIAENWQNCACAILNEK